MVITGAFGGWAWAMIPALLKTRFGTNEILVSLMLVYVAESLLASVSSGLLKNPDGMGFPGSRNLQQYPLRKHRTVCKYRHALGRGRLFHCSDFCLCGADASPARLSYPSHRTGATRGALRRRQPHRVTILCLGISGALAGMAGLFEVAGPAGQITIDFNTGYGFTAIIVAFLGRCTPWASCLPGC